VQRVIRYQNFARAKAWYVCQFRHFRNTKVRSDPEPPPDSTLSSELARRCEVRHEPLAGANRWATAASRFIVALAVRQSLNRFVLELYRLTGSGPCDAFGPIAFELLEEMLAFDSALWGTFTLTPGGALAHSLYLHKLPARMMEEYEHLKQYDVLNQQSVAQCGTTLNVSLVQVDGTTHPAMIAHARRWGMEHTLATMILESPLNLYTAVCIYRNATRHPFSERDRRRIERIAPHLVQAWHLNALHFLEGPPAAAPAVPRARAVIDRFGLLHHAEAGLAALFRCEVPDWEGPNVPAPIAAAIRQGAPEFRGNAIVASVLRDLPDKRLLISVRARAPVDALTRREMTVAREFASGKTYKEIAGLLGTSPATVRTQIERIYAKLGVRTKVELVKHVSHPA
jgi:DNA-binding CsgD family transcriptional regulator